ncbi:MAG TPA: endolytic transglycosylase MltG [Candidatus Omnitrophota bacterium]|nr:endolytic transglycosylase MltG [Candidatus Omnitrophota bacterium]
MKLVLKTVLALIVLAALAVAGAAWEGHRRFTAPGPLAASGTVFIPKGSGTQAIARLLQQGGVIRDPLVFVAATKLKKANLKAGEYEFAAGVSAEGVMRQMVEGRTLVHKLTVAEGLTVRQVLTLVNGADYLEGDVARLPREGWLLPETWHLSRADDRAEVMARMEKSMRQLLDQLWAGRDPGLPLKSKEEALVLASIVERETGVKAERPRVAAVFLNRLRLGMPLQSDPTVIYGLSDGMGVLDRPLTRADLQTAHPWNTYVNPGLPPTAIANPGRASLEAVLHPADSDDLYFVADGTGGHVFARTLDQHNANVAAWRKIERQRRGEPEPEPVVPVKKAVPVPAKKRR